MGWTAWWGCAGGEESARDDSPEDEVAPAAREGGAEGAESNVREENRGPTRRESAEGGAERETSKSKKNGCEITPRDWRGLDFHDATEMHESLGNQREVFASCFEPLPPGRKFHVEFEVEPPKIAAARPSDLAVNLTNRLEESEREGLSECLDEAVGELDIRVEPAGEGYRVTHPFCTS